MKREPFAFALDLADPRTRRAKELADANLKAVEIVCRRFRGKRWRELWAGVYSAAVNRLRWYKPELNDSPAAYLYAYLPGDVRRELSPRSRRGFLPGGQPEKPPTSSRVAWRRLPNPRFAMSVESFTHTDGNCHVLKSREPDPGESAADAVDLQPVLAALDRVEDGDLLRAFYLDGRSMRELAKERKVSATTIWSRIDCALARVSFLARAG